MILHKIVYTQQDGVVTKSRDIAVKNPISDANFSNVMCATLHCNQFHAAQQMK